MTPQPVTDPTNAALLLHAALARVHNLQGGLMWEHPDGQTMIVESEHATDSRFALDWWRVIKYGLEPSGPSMDDVAKLQDSITKLRDEIERMKG